MIWSLEPRPRPSTFWQWSAPLLAIALTTVTGGFLFAVMGYDPLASLHAFFISPLTSPYGIAELGVKAGPLVLIALGLAIGFRAGVWNIGAEGQFTMGAIAGGGVALASWGAETFLTLPLMMVAGILGGMAWAAIPAFLRTRFGVNEILVSLMLTYVALLFLSYLVFGPWKSPEGFNFPETRMFGELATLPLIWSGTRLHLGFAVSIVAVIVAWVVLAKTRFGFEVLVFGFAPRAAAYAGFAEKRLIWTTLMVSGGLAGLAGLFEVAGPIGQIVPTISPGYGFTAIIVAFLGRLHPLGIPFGGLAVAISYIGGENAQIAVGLPEAITGIFQGMLLFFLLSLDLLVRYRLRWRKR